MNANISVSRGKSLRISSSNVLKPPLSSQAQATPSTAISNVSLFLINIRLLDFDLRDDWPDITAVTFSTKDAQQNQKKRIQCVEWALYQLFVIWNPEEASDKLKPFFPPLEHLQSLNLRAALFRCLDQAKKTGILGRDAILRKTMLDECKGERLEEILAIFSTAVLKKVTKERSDGNHPTISEQLAMENFSYNGEKSSLSTLVMAHKSSLGKIIAARKDSKARYSDFADLLSLKERQSTRRHEQLKVSVEGEIANAISGEEARILRDNVEKNWAGSSEWLETILYGDNRSPNEGLLSVPFDNVWRHVEDGSIGDLEYQERKGLMEQLDARIRQQSHRLAKWQSFEKTFNKDGHKKLGREEVPDSKKRKKGVDLGFSAHETLQLIHSPLKTAGSQKPTSLGEYAQLIENMRIELSNVGKPQPGGAKLNRRDQVFKKENEARPLSSASQAETPSTFEQNHSLALNTNTDEASPNLENYARKYAFQSPPPEHVIDGEKLSPTQSVHSPAGIDNEHIGGAVDMLSTTRHASAYSDMPPPSPPSGTSSPLASEILTSMFTASPSPTKPRHVLSLAERTRLSMSHASLAKTSLHSEDTDDDLPEHPSQSLHQKVKHSSKSEIGQHTDAIGSNSVPKANNPQEDLIARTRQSMSNFAAVQKNAQIDRRRSIKAAARNKRESRSSYFSKPLEAAVEDEKVILDGLDRKKLIEGEVDVDYEVVFKSRPRIKTSPDRSYEKSPQRSPQKSPVKAWGEMGGRADVGGSSSPLSESY